MIALLDNDVKKPARQKRAMAAAPLTNLEKAGTCLDGLARISAEPNGLNGLDGSLSELFGSFEALYRDPANAALRRGIVRSAQDAAAKFRRASSRLDDLRNNLNISMQADGAPVRNGGLAELQRGLNHLASRLITRLNAIYRSGCDLNGGTGRDFFTGSDASDIGVNSIVAGDPSLVQAGGAMEEEPAHLQRCPQA
jgi:flagellar hook-associated protein FlgK